VALPRGQFLFKGALQLLQAANSRSGACFAPNLQHTKTNSATPSQGHELAQPPGTGKLTGCCLHRLPPLAEQLQEVVGRGCARLVPVTAALRSLHAAGQALRAPPGRRAGKVPAATMPNGLHGSAAGTVGNPHGAASHSGGHGAGWCWVCGGAKTRLPCDANRRLVAARIVIWMSSNASKCKLVELHTRTPC
jgi:hypothetical protein